MINISSYHYVNTLPGSIHLFRSAPVPEANNGMLESQQTLKNHLALCSTIDITWMHDEAGDMCMMADVMPPGYGEGFVAIIKQVINP